MPPKRPDTNAAGRGACVRSNYRLAIMAGDSGSDFMTVAKGLIDKYGKANDGNTDNAAAYDEGVIHELKLFWDAGIILSLAREQRTETVMLIYSDAGYEKAVSDASRKAVAQDL